MSGDGTYVRFYGRGGSKSYPPLDHNPHDPINYYRGTDGRYYYTPDGKPHKEFGQPDPATRDLSQYPVGKPEINDHWKHEAAKGYKMHPDDLKDLARALERDLNEIKAIIQRDNAPNMNPTGAMGRGYDAAEDFDKLARASSQAFSEQYGALISTYTNVIQMLRTTANNGERGEHDTHHAVRHDTGGHKPV